jgi:hypothetical protein
MIELGSRNREFWIVVCDDGPTHTTETLEEAEELAEGTAGWLEIVHVIEVRATAQEPRYQGGKS